MSFSSSYLEKRKKRLKEREKQLDNKFNNDIAPVGGNKDSWFKGGALSDGYEFGDITKTILGTVGDAGIGIVKGAGRMVEGIADVVTYGVAGVADLFGADSFAEDARDVAKFSATDEFTAPVTDYVDRFSLLGNKADSVTEGLGQVGTILLTGGAGGAAGLGTGGVTALTTGVTGLSSMGSGMSQAYTEGATDEEALTYGLIAGVAEAGTELLFGGLGKAVGAVGLSKGISSLDDALAKKVSSKIANQTMKNFAEFGIKAGAEGTEEVISGILQAFGKKATYMSEEELGKLLKDENLLDSFIVGTITSGITQSGVVPGMKRGSLIEANKQGADFITGHTETEQKVIDKVTESSVTEREKELGRKLNAKERAEIEEDVETKLIKGGISIDTIEETLGGDSYKAYKEATEKQEALKKELNELRNMKKGEMTDIQTDRLTELKAMDLEDTSKVDELKAKASQDVFELIKADRKGQGSILAESYNERERRGVAFEVDTNKVDSKKADTYKRAMEAGVLNNTNATHDFVDLVATLEAEKGVKIDFSNNEKLKASGFAVDGAEINGVKTNGGIILNANSRKNLNVVVGHEITHILEGTELYTALRDTIISYAKSKGDYDARYKATSKLYEKVKDTDIDGEITADLVGEYLFTDEKFIKSLTANKNLFQKVYDEIKYLVKVATAGSTEKKQLLKVQRAFEKAFESNKETDADHEAMGKKHLKNKDVLFNLSAVESHKSNLEKQYSNDATISLETLTERYDKVIDIWKKLGGELNSKFLNEWNNKVGKDRAFTVFKAQAGYKYNVELSSMCKKGVPLFEAIDTIVKEEVMKELDTEVIGKEEKEILYDLLKTNNFEIPCAICYVEQARQREGVIIDAFLNGKIEKNNAGKTTTFKLGWNEVLKAVEREMKANGVDYTFHAVDRSIATDKYAPADISMDEDTQDAFYKALKKVANKEITRYNKAENKNRKLVTSITPAAIKEVFKGTLPSNLKIFKVLFTEPSSRFTMESDLLYSSMTTHNLATAHNNLYSLFNSQGGVSGYKTKQGTVVYWGDILGKTWAPSKVRNEGGIRNQSNSDFQMYTLLDQVQMYVDFSAKGYYLQAYTKVLAELKLFGLSRGKINASLIPAVYVYHNSDGSIDIETTRAYAGLDKNGNLLFDDIEGINHTEAFMLLEDAEYSKSIGGICIGYSDRHIRKLLDDKRVQQIIGFHDKTDDPDKRYRGAKYAKNYNGENEAVNNEDGKTVHIGFNPYVRKAEKMFTFDAKTETYNGEIEYNGKTYVADDIPKLAADLYLEMCKKKNYTPAYNIFSDHENYYKLLADFSLYDSQGHYAPHRKVSFNMPDSVPYLDNNGKKKYMPAKDYIKAELEKELKVRDSISEALADKSETGLIPQFVKRVNESKAKQRDNQYSLSDIAPEDGTSDRASAYSYRVSPEEDAEYMDAYYDGDDDKMQELVDRVANRLGYKYKAYHHTENGFTVFDLNKARKNMDIQGFYFSADPDAESEYGSVRYDTYLKMSNPYIVDSKETQKAIPFDMSSGNAGVTAREWLQKQGYDGVIRKAEYFGAEADEYIVFDSSQIKSSEPMTFSDDEYGEGDVIPLSERFNAENSDIRYSLSEMKSSDRENIGYHAGDLGKAEYYFSQGYYRGTGHFGTGTYFVGDEEKISGSGEYGRRPHHAVDFSNYNLYKITSDKDGWELHEQLRVIDGGISQEWITAAQNDQFSLVGMTDVYDLAEERFGEDKYSDEAMESAILELADKHGIELLSREEYSEENNISLDDEDFSFYYVLDYLRSTFEAEAKKLNSNYGEFRDAYFRLWLRFGKSNTNRALQKTLLHQKDIDPDNNRTPFNEKQRKADSLSTVFMKALGYEGIDVRGTRLDNVEYGSVIYDLKEDTVLYSLSEIVAEDGTSYGIGVKLDSTLLDNLEPKDRISLVKEYVRELQGKVFTAFDEDGEPVDISIAEGNKRFRNSNGNRVATNKDLTTKHISKETKQEAIALIDELVSTASYQGSEAARHPHDWLDNDGNNEWDKWTTYIQDKNNTIWEATLHIANTTNGEKILYDISLIKKAEQSGKSDTSLLTLGQSGESDTIPDVNSIAPLPGNVKRDAKFSLSDTEDIAPVDNIVDNVDIAPIAKKYSDIEEQIKANEEKLESLMAEYEKISNMVDNGEMSVADFDFRAEDITKEYDETKRRIDALTYELTEIEKNNVTVTDAIKNYSKKDALTVVERMGVNDLTKVARKKLADDLWEGMNKNTTVEQREAFAREFAKTATDTIVKKSRTENPNYNSAKEQLPYIASGIGRLTFTADDMAELKYKYDKDLKKFLGRWGYKGGTNADGTPKRRYPMSQFVIDYARETAGMSHLEDMHHAEAMVEINELYEDLSAEVKNRWVNSYEEATKEEIESLKADIERTVLEAFETEGRDARVKKGLEAAYDKIDKQFEADKASLDKAFEKSKENALATLNEKDRSAYIAHLEERYAMRLAELTEQVKREKELAKKESERVRRKDLHNSIIEAIKAEYTKRGLDFDEVLDKGKRKGNFASVDNTPQRFIEKTLGYKEGQILNDLTVNKIALNESAGVKWLNGQVDNIRKLSEKYNIKPGSKESAAAQMYGEGFYVNKEGEYVKYGDAELAKDFPSIEVQNNIKALAKNSEVRRMYDETLDAINASRVRNGYPEIPKRADYFLHFRAMDDTFSRLGIPFNPNDIKAKDLPTDINGMTANLKPGQPYFASANKRMGIRTTYDLLGGIERYMNSAKNQIYHIDDIQTLRAVRNYVADRYGQANGLNDLDSMTPDEQEARIKDVYDGHLSTFAKFLNEEANIIAGKTSLMDRSVEGIFGRRAMQVLNTINSQVGKNMVGFNIGSAGTNFLPLVQAAAKLRKSDMIKAFSQTISNKFNSDGFVENDPALIRRKGADKFAKTAWEKWSDIGYVLMSAVDNLTSEVIVRAKYNELTRSGLDSEQAHIKAGEWASRLMGDRSLGQMPQLFNSKTLGIFTKFQLEVRNQLDSMFYDSFQEAKENTENIQDAKERNVKTAAKVASTLAQLFVFQHIFGMVYEQIAGYNPTFDILSTLATLFGWDDEEESEDTFGDNLQQAFNELLEDLPYTSTFTGGRIPMSAALPVEQLLTGEDEWGNEVSQLETLAESVPYLLPTGWGQLKKTRDGLRMFSDEHPIAGSYTDSGNLRFPVEETPLNIAQAAVFGQYANKNAREYFDNEYAPLTPNQVEEFMATGMSYSEYSKKKKTKKIKEAKAKELIYSIVGGEDLYQEYTDALSEIKAGVYVDRKTRVLGYLNSLDIDYVTKLILYKKQFPNDKRFNVALVNYLNERDDISYSEMETILTELGFQVDEDGNIKW